MKKHFSFYLFNILIFCSLMTQAMEGQKDESVIQELQKITALVFPSPVYLYDSHPNDEKKYAMASKAIQENVLIFTLPIEIFPELVFPHMDSRTLLRLGGTCVFFNQLSQLSFLFLNDYCLTERMPHQISVSTLCFKTHNTMHGLLKLAALVSVSTEDICGWFEAPYLESIFLFCYGSLPQQLAGQSEEELGKLYPILKIAVAATQAKVTDEAQTSHIMRLVREYPYRSGLSFNKLRLLSLNPDRPGNYEETIHQLLHGEHGYGFGKMEIASSQERDVIAKELLLRGKSIGSLYSICFPYDHQKVEAIEIQLLGLCIQYPNLYALHDSAFLIHNALRLQRSDLALKLLFNVIEAPDDEIMLAGKINAFLAVRDMKEEKVQGLLKEFSSSLYNRYWKQLPAPAKGGGLSLLIHTDRREDVEAAVKDILTLPAEETLHIIPCSLDDLLKHGYSEEIRDFILNALNMEYAKFISSVPYIMDTFFEHAVKVDREKTIGLLKAYLETQIALKSPKTTILSLLAKFSATEEERDYVTSHVQSLKEEEKNDDSDSDLCAIYYYLKNEKLCHFYYQKLFEKLLNYNDNAEKQGFLQDVQEAGLNIAKIEEMLTMDPFEVLSILYKEEALGI